MNATTAVAEVTSKAGGNSVPADKLRNLVERIERLDAERKTISDDIRDLMAEAKSAGLSTKVLRRLLQLRKLDPEDAEEQEFLLSLYRDAVK